MGQLGLALKKAKQVKNYFPSLGNYHDLDAFEKNSFDLVFVVEALCYSAKKEVVLSEVCRVLRPEGRFIIFDGYRAKDVSQLEDDEELALRLTEKGMAVDFFATYESLMAKITGANFSIKFEEDVSRFVIPTMLRFERIASLFFRYPFLAKILTHFLPKEFTYNAISGYLMPTLIREGLAKYMITVLQKD